MRLRSRINRTVSLGLKIDRNLEEKVKFLNDKEIPEMDVNQTCERCYLDKSECKERTVPNTVYNRSRKEKILKKSLEELFFDFRRNQLKI